MCDTVPMSKRDAIVVTCPATLCECRCGLDPHPADVPHECVDADPICGGSWLDHPSDPAKVLVVRWPGIRGNAYAMAQARREGLGELTDPPPGEPVEDYRPVTYMARRGGISYLPADLAAGVRREDEVHND